jgi:PBP1b-binding outer membrane lipoprotein LpoB
MKKLLLITTIAVILVSCAKENVGSSSSSTTASTSSSSTEDKVGTPPTAVTTAFVAKFGNVAVTEWKVRSDGTWRAHFTKNGVAWEATFTAAGALVKSEAAR